ncbi:hypothetical protein B0H14DRAFT_3861818 [Mycena olivaceomarginata]|nr:hypothetical protein B0H14DRAFT_3861818 [Mycena olivaceomarginata]
MARSTPSAHALRHPNRKVQLARPRRKHVSAAAKATKALAAAQGKRQKILFQEAIDEVFADRNAAIVKIAKDFGKQEHVVRAILCAASPLKTSRKPSLLRAVIHDRWRQYQEDGEPQTMLEIRAELTQEIEDGTFNLQDIDEDEAERLKKQLLDHRNHNKRSMRTTSKAAQMDGRLTARLVSDTLVNLFHRTGIRAFAFFSRGNNADPSLPHCVDSDNALKFFPQALDQDELTVMQKFEQWSCIQDEGPDERDDVAGVRSEVSQLMVQGLRYITNKSTLKMNYVNYDVCIREVHGVEFVGLPADIVFSRAALWNLETARRVRAGMKDGSMGWVRMTKEQHNALIAQHNSVRAQLGSGSLKKRATRSDKGTKRTKGQKDAVAGPTAREGSPTLPTLAMPGAGAGFLHPTSMLVDPATLPFGGLEPIALETMLHADDLISFDMEDIQRGMQYYGSEQVLPTLRAPTISPPTSPTRSSSQDQHNTLEGLGTTSTNANAAAGGSTRRPRDPDSDDEDVSPPAKKARKVRSDKGKPRGENRAATPTALAFAPAATSRARFARTKV